ncbi:MAG TPA: hypothetical protein VLC95_15495 [Anaerolineae bacterium]|nr:hypothetical protein [Anaerolineae bacterium]
MSEYERRRDEKQEKNEKDSGDNWDEKWRNDPVNAAVWALILIWAGLVLLFENMEVLDFGTPGAVSVGFVGAGLILLGGVVVRLVVPAYRRPVTGSVILGLVFIGIGLGNLFSWDVVLPLVLIAIGIAGLLAYFRTRR